MFVYIKRKNEIFERMMAFELLQTGSKIFCIFMKNRKKQNARKTVGVIGHQYKLLPSPGFL